jgi:hypothetical protein
LTKNSADLSTVRFDSKSQADKFIQRFTGVLTHEGSDLGDYLTTADKLLASNFVEISGSINSLAGFPVCIFGLLT